MKKQNKNQNWFILEKCTEKIHNLPNIKSWKIRSEYKMKNGEILFASNDLKFEKENMSNHSGSKKYFTTYIARNAKETKNGLRSSDWICVKINLYEVKSLTAI